MPADQRTDSALLDILRSPTYRDTLNIVLNEPVSSADVASGISHMSIESPGRTTSAADAMIVRSQDDNIRAMVIALQRTFPGV